MLPKTSGLVIIIHGVEELDTSSRGERDLEKHHENENGLFKLYPHIYPIETVYCRDPLLLIGDVMSLCGTNGEMTEYH